MSAHGDHRHGAQRHGAHRSRPTGRPAAVAWLRALADVVLVAAATLALSTSLLVAWWAPVAVVAGAVACAAIAIWVRLLARRDTRALVVLWLVFALNRTFALLAGDGPVGSVMSSLDDIALGVALVVVVLTGVRCTGLPRSLVVAFCGLFVFGVAGVLGAVLAGVVAPAVLLGTWLGCKLLVCLFVTTQFRWSEDDIRRAQRVAAVLIGLVVVVALVQLVEPGLVYRVLGAQRRVRLGQDVVTSIFREPSQYSVFMIFAMSGLVAAHPLSRRRLLAAAVTGVGAVLSLRLKTLVDLVLVLVGRLAVSPSRLRWATPVALVVGGAAVTYLGGPLFRARAPVLFGDERSARQILYQTAGSLAGRHLPFGGGFGSFGSEASITYYSPVYAEYGMADAFGFSEARPQFLHDASWATVLGEGGWLGAAGAAVALGALLALLLRRAVTRGAGRRGDCARAGFLFGMAFIADSVTSPQFFAGFACLTLATLVSMSLGEGGPAAGTASGATVLASGRPAGPTPAPD
ncbi:hypothetical protein [Blastococcus sp. SYSU D00695]